MAFLSSEMPIQRLHNYRREEASRQAVRFQHTMVDRQRTFVPHTNGQRR
jgi:hypothetical protein